MDNKIVTARFATDDNYVNVYDVYQWSYGQVLRIEGLKLPNMVEIHFSLQETSGEAKTRIGVTKDGVTDVVIPDSFLENEGIGDKYKIFVWVYVADKNSGSTEYKITIHVKARAKPEITHGGQDGEVFQEAVEAVRDAAARAAESEKQAERWAVGRVDIPGSETDNSKFYSEESKKNAQQTTKDKEAVEELVKETENIGQLAEDVKANAQKASESAKNAETSATNASASEKNAKTSESNASTSETNAKASEANAKASEQAVEKSKQTVDKTVADFGQAVTDASAALKSEKDAHVKAITTAGTTETKKVTDEGAKQVQTVQSIGTQETEKVTAEGTKQVGLVKTEGEKQVQAVQIAAQEIIADMEQNGNRLTSEVKTALMAVVENIGLWANGDGQTLIDNLRTALYSAPISSITAVYTQTKTVYASDSLDALRDDLIVTATYTDGTSSVLTDYALSGSLRVGTSTVTVSKDGKTTTFSVTVTAARVPATGITLDKTTLSLVSSAPAQLTATVTPENTTDSVVWASSEEAVAKVSSDGTVTPVADGSCVISATAGDFTAECSVTVSLPLNGLNIGNPYLMNVNDMPSSVAATEEEAQEKWYKALFTAWTSNLGIEKIFFLHPFTNGTFYIRMLGRTASDPIEFYAFENVDIGFNPTATLGKVGGTFTDATVTKFTSFDWVDKDGNEKSGVVDLGNWEYVDGSGSTYLAAYLVLYKITVPENVYVFMSTSEMSVNRFPGISENYPLNDLYTIFDKNPSANILQIVE